MIERILIEHALIIIRGSCDLLRRGWQTLSVLKVVAGGEIKCVEVVLALHWAGFEANYYRCLKNRIGFKNSREMGVGNKGEGFYVSKGRKRGIRGGMDWKK